jgi:hypothetical protein
VPFAILAAIAVDRAKELWVDFGYQGLFGSTILCLGFTSYISSGN